MNGRKLSEQQLITKLNKGGWKVHGGKQVRKGVVPQFTITGAMLNDGKVVIGGGEHMLPLAYQGIRFAQSGPASIEVYHSTTRQMRKADGSGMTEEHIEEVVLHLSK